MNHKEFRIEVFKKAALCRHFENKVYKLVEKKIIKIPVYLSAGQEYISASLASIIQSSKNKPLLFPQHRCHSTYLSFGGNIIGLIDELLGRKSGCANGMGGSASIHSPEINLYGHDGLMGSQVPISVGACFTSKKSTIVFMGDASAEEDYVFGAIGWASTKNLPIVFIIEDNNLSILTEKRVRRNWEMDDVGRAFKIKSFNINDDPIEIFNNTKDLFNGPSLFNINTNRLYWHAGAGTDSPDTFDRFKEERKALGSQAEDLSEEIKKYVALKWEQRLEKQ